ncbi:TlyA family RNA methyltransferase [Lachnoclostridium sp. Marseille-P6806]|uniref:TlyA family RNA methyltransferase n=1 Tax=Lachnoclostridium sp. Marseille-P6806 TaxID=2364793 RepID=UPI00102F34EB|nr:TlyA family RNA methyltransferase [Lachnoclostridium sp. Marseille-P6806]
MKTRLDILLMERGLAPTREKAKACIMAGIVYVNGQREDKAGTGFDPDPEHTAIEIRGQALRYVSRGGLKLEKALAVFPISLRGKTCMDIGASTGGFTDCMLINGAARVYAIDVGYGQLDWKLRNDPRVVCMEKTNFRYLTRRELEEADEKAGGEDPAALPEFASCDVSFISLSKILPAARDILPMEGEMVCLIKPQFEAGRDRVGKKGVVRDPAVHEGVIRRVAEYAEAAGFCVRGLDYSPIRGPEGNIEYLLWLGGAGERTELTDGSIAALVGAAHEELDRQA